jgi:hypothetical protein
VRRLVLFQVKGGRSGSMRIYRLTTINVSLNFDTNAANDDYPRVCSATLDHANYSDCSSSGDGSTSATCRHLSPGCKSPGSRAAHRPRGYSRRWATTTAADTSALATTISRNGSPCQSFTYNGTVSMTSPPDLGSGIASTRCTLDGGIPTPSSPTDTGPISLTANTRFLRCSGCR